MTPKKARPKALPGITYEMKTHCGKIYITVTSEPSGHISEVFVRFGRAGGCGAAIFDGLTKLLSYALRSGMEPAYAVKAFSGISCHHGQETCLNAVAEAMLDYQNRTQYLSINI
jgi:hypothetical protein